MKIVEKFSPERLVQFQAEAVAFRTLISSASHASASLDNFALWFLTAFGAGLTVLLSNYKDLEGLIPVPQLKESASLFVCAVIFGVVQKYFAAVITSAAASAKDGEQIGKENPDLDFDHYIDSVRNALPQPIRFLANGMFKKIQHGEFLIAGKLIMTLVLVQGLMLFGQSFALIRALAKIFPS